MKQLEMGAETYVKCSRVLTRKEKCEETVLLLTNLSAIESKKMKETIKAFVKNFHNILNNFYTFLCAATLFSIILTLKKLLRVLEKFIFSFHSFYGIFFS